MRLSRRWILFPVMVVTILAAVTSAASYFWQADRRQAGQSTPAAGPTPSVTAMPTPTPSPGPVALGDTIPGDTIVVLSARPVHTLDPYLTTSIVPEESIAAHIWEPLVWVSDNLQLEPRLAESWQVINDFTWEFKLRQGVSFHNGEPFNAQAVKFSLERGWKLEGSLETFADDVGLQDVEIVDDYTVRLHVAQATVNVPFELASVEMLPPGYYGSASREDAVARPVGSGPYRFERWDQGEGVILSANQEYWGGAPRAETLVFGSQADVQQRLVDLESGLADIISDIPPALFSQADTPASRGVTIESARRFLIGMRGDDGTPLADTRVRQALNYAVNVDRIVQESQSGYGQRYASYVSPPNADPSLSPWPYDPDRARSLLAEAGYPDGFDMVMDVPLDRYVDGETIAGAVAEDLAQVGVRVELRDQEWPEYVRQLLARESSPLFLLTMSSRGNDLEDARNLAYLFPFNPTGWYNPDFEALLAEAASTYNRDKRRELLSRAQAIAFEEAPWICLWRPYEFYGVAHDLAWSPRPDALIYLYQSNE